MVYTQTVKGICTIIAGIFIHLLLGNIYTWGNINGYYVSYIKIEQPDFTLLDGYFMVPTTIFVQHLIIVICGYFEKLFGSRILTFFCFTCAVGAHVILYFCTNYWVIIIAMGLYGVGIAFGYFPVLKTCWSYFPKQRGIITGSVLCCYGLSPFIFTSLADYIINPEGKKSEEGYFPKEIAERTPKFILVLTIIMGVGGFIASSLVFPYKPEQDQAPPEGTNTISNDTEENILNKDNEQEKLNSEEKKVDKEKEEELKRQSNKRFKQAMTSLTFWCMTMIVNGIVFFGYVATNTNRTFGSINELDEKTLQTLSKVYSIINGSMRIVWGFIFDKVNFKTMYYIIITNHCICAFSYYFCGQDNILFFIVNCMTALSFSGHTTIYGPTMIFYFGVENSIMLLGIIGITQGCNGLLAPMLCKFLISERSDFLIIYLIGGTLVVFAMIALVLLKKVPFDYEAQSNGCFNEMLNKPPSIEPVKETTQETENDNENQPQVA